MNKEYLGDSVYVEDWNDGYGLALFLDNGAGAHTMIFLEKSVLSSLKRYIEKFEQGE